MAMPNPNASAIPDVDLARKFVGLSWHVRTVQATKLTSPDAATSFTPAAVARAGVTG